jgi:hypothetical protein
MSHDTTTSDSEKPRLRHSHVFARAEHDHYVEPQWCSVRLFETVSFGPPGARVLDPACGWGRILKAAKDAGYTPIGGDIVDRLQRRELGLQKVAFQRRDFLTSPILPNITSVVTNSPYGDLLQPFCERAVETASFRVAVLSRLARIAAAEDWLTRLPLVRIYVMSPRPSIPPGKYITDGGYVGGDRQEYCWLIFDHRARPGTPPQVCWLNRNANA